MNSGSITQNKAFLDQLRQKTAPQHSLLEQVPLSASLVSPGLTREEYGKYLLLMYGVIADIETNIFELIAPYITDLEQRRKLPLIQSDLDFLNLDYTTYAKSPFTAAGQTMSPAFAMGIMYVVEGSILGGRFILKNVNATLGLSDKGAEYFSGYKQNTGSLWKSFLAQLTAFEEQNNNEEEIIAGAQYAFQSIYKHMLAPGNYEN